MYPEKICHQSDELLSSILMTIQMGLMTLGPDVTNKCCDFIQNLGSYLHQYGQNNCSAYQALKPFLKVT